MEPREYRCAMCKGVFMTEWSDDEAASEAVSKGIDMSDVDVVCDDCYKQTPWGNEATV